jgi:4-hydroxy-4-methyl-2-oxoglutarate aldolase
LTTVPSIASRIFVGTLRPPAELIAPFRGTPAGNVCDAMDRLGAMDYRIKPLAPSLHLCGPALTVRTRPGDNLLVWKAVDIAQPGDVLVIATYEHSTVSTFGENVVKAAKTKGIAGIVCDGLCRDISGIRATGLPTFAIGSVPSSPGKDGPGEIGGAVSCGGIAVHSGDLIVGDEDGIVVVPYGDLATVGARLAAIAAKEARMEADLAAGMILPSWVDTVLEERGCEVVDLTSRG